MTDHAKELREAGQAYEQAKQQAERILTPPREDLAAKARAAYEAGNKKAQILRWMGHVWSDTWLNKVLEGVTPPPGTATRKPARKTTRGKK